MTILLCLGSAHLAGQIPVIPKGGNPFSNTNPNLPAIRYWFQYVMIIYTNIHIYIYPYRVGPPSYNKSVQNPLQIYRSIPLINSSWPQLLDLCSPTWLWISKTIPCFLHRLRRCKRAPASRRHRGTASQKRLLRKKGATCHQVARRPNMVGLCLPNFGYVHV